MTIAAEPILLRAGSSELNQLARAHPELDAAHSSGLLVMTDSAVELELLTVLLTELGRRRHHDEAGMRAVLDALLPPGALRVSEPVLGQVTRNAVARKELAEEFGALTSAEVAQAAGSKARNSAATVSRWRAAHLLFAVEDGSELLVPGFQLGPDGKPRPIIAEVLAEFDGVLAGWDLALWFTAGNGWLGGARPVDAMTGSDSDRAAVVAAARRLAAELSPASMPEAG